MTTSRGIAETKIYDRAGVIERYGIPPERVTDFIGLKGDKSDNIPGVPGIGDKTAAQLLQEYDSLEGVLEHVDEIKGPKRQQNLRENADLARLSKQLATLNREIDDRASTSRRSPRPSPIARACARCSPAGSCATRCAASRRRSARRRRLAPSAAAQPEVTAVEGTLADLAGPGAATALALETAESGLRWAAWTGEGDIAARRGRLARRAARPSGAIDR